MIIHDSYCVQLCKFPNYNSLRTKVDFKFSSKNSLFDKWLQTLKQNVVLCLLCLNIPRLSGKYLVLFIYKLLDEGQTRLLSNLRTAAMLPKSLQLLRSLRYSKLKLTRSLCGKSTKQNKQLTLYKDRCPPGTNVACIKAMIQIFSHHQWFIIVNIYC